ncbi:ComEA family DNA-binding protein [Desulfoscipio gibsoniae]|uniref:Competence protein ComEA-like protein with helix-hairpin-helix repeat region n=1 Tax=Desulfoscipio gibsoniae DSM 7213 TaxID=767817 RepID=R4KJU2_9FIRM|nr:ComEA family DNA-binding protein [Desulfoscipio gibsoniae]AGL00805.1 competence protein ComEA-like protein with helix-hairpin-helix repeat region [Desulfoscipio gibsoniae DSM 7213]
MFQLEKRHQLVLLILAAVILFGAGHKYARMQAGGPLVSDSLVTGMAENSNLNGTGSIPLNNLTEEQNDVRDTQIIVHVAGAVQKPGVYRLPAGSRVVDAVNMAGPTEKSALDYMNLAAVLEDGKQITVYSLEQIGGQQLPGSVTGGMTAEGAPVSGFGVSVNAGVININTASMAQLEDLPGIGPSLAQRIIDYRTQNGPFMTIEDIQNVSGIGEKRFEQLKGLICVN